MRLSAKQFRTWNSEDFKLLVESVIQELGFSYMQKPSVEYHHRSELNLVTCPSFTVSYHFNLRVYVCVLGVWTKNKFIHLLPYYIILILDDYVCVLGV